jgi:hypothetical protein
MRHREHSDEAIILGSGASTNEAIRSLTQIVAPQKGAENHDSTKHIGNVTLILLCHKAAPI